jgi:hypothetical protein
MVDQSVVAAAEQPVEQTAPCEQVGKVDVVVLPAACCAPRPHQTDEDGSVERGEQVEERRRHDRPDDRARGGEALLHARGSLGRERDPEGQREHDRRVAEREREADAERAAALLHQVAGRVVNRRDVVGVERVPDAEQVGGQPGPRVHGRGPARPAEAKLSAVPHEQAEPRDVQREHDAVQGHEPCGPRHLRDTDARERPVPDCLAHRFPPVMRAR